VNRGRSEEVGAALDLFPEHLRERLKFDVFCGDPVAAGVADYDISGPTLGRSPRNTAHVLYPWRSFDRRTTIVVPGPREVATWVHEIAHVLDLEMEFKVDAQPVSWYAGTNRQEAFAEFVTAALVPGYLAPYDDRGVEYVQRQQEPLTLLGLR
jgi:hypothetical protein